MRVSAYARAVTGKSDKTPFAWGSRFRSLIRAKNVSLADLAERIGKSESALRSYTNGTRPIQLADFLHLCKAAEVDPAAVLFAGGVDPRFLLVGQAWVVASDLQRGVLVTAAKGVLAEHGAAASQGSKPR